MPYEKIDAFLNCYFSTLEIDNEQEKNSIREAIIKRYDKYKDCFPFISINEDNFQNYAIKSTNGYYPLEDFLLNRLFQSVRYIFSIKDKDAESSFYNEKSRSIGIMADAIDETAQVYLRGWEDELKEIFIELTIKTVLDHELGHALKTQFSGGFKIREDSSKRLMEIMYSTILKYLGEEKGKEAFSKLDFSEMLSDDDRFKVLLNNLRKISDNYSTTIISDDELIEEYSTAKESGIKKESYLGKKCITLIDELLQETESMEIIDLYKIPQNRLRIGNNGNYINVFFLLSDYKFMHGYGKILTSLLGNKGTFQATYLNPSPVLERFDSEYQDISQEVFANGLSPMTNIGESLVKLKASKDEDTYLLLDVFFAKCYRKMIMQKLNDDSTLDIDSIINEIESFQIRLTTNDDEQIRNNLPHNIVFEELKKILLQLKEAKTK